MALLIASMALWILAHSVKTFTPKLRQTLEDRYGEPVKGILALAIIASVIGLIFGWRASEPVALFSPLLPTWLVVSIVWLGMVSLVSSGKPVHWGRFWHHPQLYGVALFAMAHFLGSGSQRSLVLFGGLALWSLVSVVAIYRRDGKPEVPAPTMQGSAQALIGGSIFTFVLAATHQWLSGYTLLELW
ncbi:NnrU family protein [Salinibius halmophilus]|uniref:NnrU family protein n=1 Tax=Salinibius halmophilus TaxID=1853216 RepID=UPI000E672C1C|nr:NnrU family protein [Salinibius halmophilus]